MKIYFSGSIHDKRDTVSTYKRIIEYLTKQGHTVLSEHVTDSTLIDKIGVPLSNYDIYRRNMVWLRESDVILAEITNHDLDTGYEIAVAQLLYRKPVACFARRNTKVSARITDSAIDFYTYESDEHLLTSIGFYIDRMSDVDCDYNRAKSIVKGLGGEDGWYRGFPNDLVNIAIDLKREGLAWQHIESVMQSITQTVINEYT